MLTLKATVSIHHGYESLGQCQGGRAAAYAFERG
jgi:hypothetical protein